MGTALRSAAAVAMAYGQHEEGSGYPVDMGWGWLLMALILLGMILALYANSMRMPPRHHS